MSNWTEFWAQHEPAAIHAGPRLFCMGDQEPWPCSAVTAEVQPTPPHGINRDADANAAWEAYRDGEWQGWDSLHEDLHAAFLAGWVARPVRPVEGVILTRKDAALFIRLLRGGGWTDKADALEASV